jgi:hypothetical protein
MTRLLNALRHGLVMDELPAWSPTPIKQDAESTPTAIDLVPTQRESESETLAPA